MGESTETPGDVSTDGQTPNPADEPILPSIGEQIAAIAVLAMMVSALAYILWTVVRFWNEVGV
jgi:hypothetical protein